MSKLYGKQGSMKFIILILIAIMFTAGCMHKVCPVCGFEYNIFIGDSPK
jgi:hypothetical protein